MAVEADRGARQPEAARADRPRPRPARRPGRFRDRVPRRSLRPALPLDVDPVDPSGEWLRHIPRNANPYHRPEPPGDSRWQRGRIVDALYLAHDEATLWAEWYRHLAEHGIPPLRQLPRDVWRYRVPVPSVADLSDTARLARVGLGPPTPGRKSWPAYQAVGEQLWRESWAGLIVPSAAWPESLVLCLFSTDAASLPAEPVPPPTTVAEPPAPPTGMRT